MTKALVINGLHRSGTTMLARLIDSQPNMACFGNIFEMLKIIGFMRGINDKNLILRESFTSGPNQITEKSHDLLRAVLKNSFVAEIAHMVSHPHFFDDGKGQVYGLSLDEIFGLANIIFQHQPINDIASLLAALGDQVKVPVFGTKWTSAHNYTPEFLSSPNAYWLEIIRLPYATRASEELRKGNVFWSNFKDHEDAFRFTSTFRHKRFHVVRYEELCEDTDNCLKKISDWLGEKIRNVELTNPLGGKFHPMTSYQTLEGGSVEAQNQSLDPNIGSLDINRWRKNFTEKQMAFVNLAIDFCGLYEKEQIGLPARIYAYGQLAQVRTYYAFRASLLGLLKPLGITITRAQPFGITIKCAPKRISL